MKKYLFLCAVLAAMFAQSCNKDGDNFLKIDKSHLERGFNVLGGSASVPVNCNTSFDAVSSAAWCRATIVGNSVKIEVDELHGGGDRLAEITVSAKGAQPVTINVIQSALTFDKLPSALTFPVEGGETAIEIISGSPFTLEYPSWIRLKDNVDWSWGARVYTFAAEMYEGDDSGRSGELWIRPTNGDIISIGIPVEQGSYTNEAISTMRALWQTSPLNVGGARRELLGTIQAYSEGLGPDHFKSYLALTNETAAVESERNTPILSCYRYAFDHILDRVKHEEVAYGTTAIWMLYNMGFIVKTPSVCFGIDVNHRLAAMFAPYLDFLCVTHDHADHKSVELMSAMHSAGKPVLSNFYKASSQYYATIARNYTIGDIGIRTCITDHDSSTPNFTTAFRIDCGGDSGDFSIMHCGDSSFDPAQYAYVGGGDVSLLVLRNGNKAENNIVGSGAGKVEPSCVFLSHVIELRHQIGVSPIRFEIPNTLNNAKNITGGAYLPFWGEKFVWRDGAMTWGD